MLARIAQPLSDAAVTAATLALSAIAAVAAAPVGAQTLYRYADAGGNWVFSDRQPAGGEAFERIDFGFEAETPGLVRLYQFEDEDGRTLLAAENSFHGPVQVAFRIVAADNLSSDTPVRGNRILGPRSDSVLLALLPNIDDEPVAARFEYQYIHGSPAARHEPDAPYRLPYALARHFRVSQAYPDELTHADPANAHAVDFEMPVGTNVFAAREGLVLDVASDYFEGGTEANLVQRANQIRILHEDGTIALYAHLNWNTIRVVPGQRVGRGEYIADSGNTGFSSGPHLHFVVQINAGGEVASVPVEFAMSGGRSISLRTGDDIVAY